MPDQLSVQDFAGKIRSKYPGAYDSVSDEDLANKVLAKYPTYRDQVNIPQGPQQTGLSDQLRQMTAAMSGQTSTLSPEEIAQGEAGKKAGMKAASETTGGILGGAVTEAPGLLGAFLRMVGAGGGSAAANAAAQKATTGTINPTETAKVAGTAGVLQGVGEGLSAIPLTEHAAATLESIKKTAGNIPIDVAKPGDTALELYTQSQRGATLPKAVRDLVNRMTKPDASPLTYSEAKDFQTNISRLSADEVGKLNAPTKRLIGQLNSDLKISLQDAADVVNRGQDFADAMKEYHQAQQFKNAVTTVAKATPYIGGGLTLLDVLKQYVMPKGGTPR